MDKEAQTLAQTWLTQRTVVWLTARCLASGEHGVALLDIYQQFCTDVSLADFLVISAEAVIMSTRARHIASNPGALPLDFRSRFRFWPSHSYIVSIRRGSLA